MDIQPGLYAGMTGTDMLNSCHWRRLSGASGESEEIIAIQIVEGQYYVEIQPSDSYFSTTCEMTPIDDWPTPSKLLSAFGEGTYIIGRDIAPGRYEGKAGTDILDSCHWRRLSGVSGESEEIIAIQIVEGQYYVSVDASTTTTP